MTDTREGWLCPQQVETMIAAAIRAANEGTDARVESAVRAATSGSATSVQQMKKPTIPAFDPKHIEIWIKRMTAAFDRLSITDPKLKFANLDEKIPADSDPKINEFMWGAPTTARWDEFIAYLRKKHGRTTKTKAVSVIEGTERDGRCPSQLWAVMLDKADDVTLDDILKEQLLRRLSKDIKGHLQDRIKGKTGKQVADMADEYFDEQGNELNRPASSVNSIRPALKKTEAPSSTPTTSSTRAAESSDFTTAYADDEDSDINAVRFRQGQKQHFNVNNRSQSRGRSSNGNSSGSFGNSSNNNNNFRPRQREASTGRSHNPQNDNSSKPKICRWHIKFGEEATRCEHWCVLKGKMGKDKANR